MTMLLNTLSFILGLWVVAYFRTLPSSIHCCIGLVIIALFWLMTSTERLQQLLLVMIFFQLGITWNVYQAQQWLSKQLPRQLIKQDTLVTGLITGLPVEHRQYTSFLLTTDHFGEQSQVRHLQLNWQNPHPTLHAGERWQLTVRLKPPHGLVNFSGNNRLRMWWVRDIHANGYVIAKPEAQRLAVSPRWNVNNLRQQLQEITSQTVADPSLAAVITALTIGVESNLSEDDWEVLQRTGTVHLVVIAGLHIGFMVIIAHWLANYGWRCFPWLMLRLPAQRAAAMGAMIFAVIYAGLTGFGIPAQRAVIMIIVFMLAQLFYRDIAVWRRIIIALMIVLLWQPQALFTAGFWLSFAAVGWISYALLASQQLPRWQQWLRIQWALLLGLMPLTLYFFQQFSLVSLLANLPAILWVEWLIVPLCLMAAVASMVQVALGAWLFKMAAYILAPLWHLLQWISAWPLAGWHHPAPSLWVMVVSLLGAAWILAPPAVPLRWCGIIGFLPLWLIPSPKPEFGAVWITLLDVGQGLSAVIQTASHLLIYDTGMRIPNGFDAGRNIITPYLWSLSARKINMLVISHGDNDHSGGARAILQAWPIQQVLTSVPNMFIHFPAQSCTVGQQWQWDGISFRILSPVKNSIYQDNNSSCVLQIGHEILLTGDIEAAAEQDLVARYGHELQTKILVVPHHGSKTSSTPGFLSAVNPQYVLYSAGYVNRFHFPAPSVVKRYQALDAQALLTARDGAIVMKVFPNGQVEVHTANPHRYFWQ